MSAVPGDANGVDWSLPVKWPHECVCDWCGEPWTSEHDGEPHCQECNALYAEGCQHPGPTSEPEASDEINEGL
jgi:hypothetical protein